MRRDELLASQQVDVAVRLPGWFVPAYDGAVEGGYSGTFEEWIDDVLSVMQSMVLIDPAYPTRKFRQTIVIRNAGTPDEYVEPFYEELTL